MVIKYAVYGCGLDSSGPRQGQVAGFYEYGNEPSSYTKSEVSLHQLSDYELRKKNSAPWNLIILYEIKVQKVTRP
jgi:hypothetical protein